MVSTCSDCKKTKSDEEMRKNSTKCKECINAKTKAAKELNEKTKLPEGTKPEKEVKDTKKDTKDTKKDAKKEVKDKTVFDLAKFTRQLNKVEKSYEKFLGLAKDKDLNRTQAAVALAELITQLTKSNENLTAK